MRATVIALSIAALAACDQQPEAASAPDPGNAAALGHDSIPTC
jgi:hypothetical protein